MPTHGVARSAKSVPGREQLSNEQKQELAWKDFAVSLGYQISDIEGEELTEMNAAAARLHKMRLSAGYSLAGVKTSAHDDVSITFKYRSLSENLAMPTSLTISELVVSIWRLLNIPPTNLKLICKGKRVTIDPESKELVTCLDKQIVRVMGSTTEVLQAFRAKSASVKAEEAYYVYREKLYQQNWRFQRKMYQEYMLDRGETEPTAPPTNRRVFGIDATQTDRAQDRLAFFFDVGLCPDLECTSECEGEWPTDEGCQHHTDVFLIKWYCFTRHYLLCDAGYLALQNREHRTMERYRKTKAVMDRVNRLDTAWKSQTTQFLHVLLEELENIETLLDFNCDFSHDWQGDKEPEGPLTQDLQADIFSLQLAIGFLQGAYNKRKPGEKSTNTDVAFLTYRP